MSESSLTYGLNSGGFVRMRLPEVRRAIYNDLTSRTGLVFDESPDSFTGQFVSVFSDREAALWELLEQVYLSAYPVTANGIPLDLAVSYSGVRRLQPVRSRALVYLYGTPGTVVPAGSLVQASVAADAADIPPRFFIETTTTITKTAAVIVSLTVPGPVVEGTIYWVDVDGVRYSHTATTGQNETAIAAALDAQIGNDAVATGETLVIQKAEAFVTDWSNNLTTNYVATPAQLLSEEFGPIPVAEGKLTEILSPVLGWNSVRNPFSAVLGQLLETDDALRVRYALGVYRLGAGTLPSIYANLIQNVPGITSLRVFENPTAFVDGDDRPPHSIEIIAEGGDNDAIYRELFRIKPAGIGTYGNTLGTVRAADGYVHNVRFSRPELRWVWLRITLATNSEEVIPGDIRGRVVAAILAEGAKFVAGQDLLLQRLQAAPFSATTGLSSVAISASVTVANGNQPPASAYFTTDVPMGPRQKAVFDISRIVFV